MRKQAKYVFILALSLVMASFSSLNTYEEGFPLPPIHKEDFSIHMVIGSKEYKYEHLTRKQYDSFWLCDTQPNSVFHLQ